MPNKFIQFVTTDGMPVSLNVDCIESFSPMRISGLEKFDRNKTIIFLSGPTEGAFRVPIPYKEFVNLVNEAQEDQQIPSSSG